MSDCGCKGKPPAYAATPAITTPYDNQAHELLATPKSKVELVRPEKPDASRPVLEYFAGNAIKGNKPSLPSVFAIGSAMRGLSFQGVLPWNMVAVVMPLDNSGPLMTDATLMAFSQAVNGYGGIIGMPSLAGVDQFWVMRPGEVIDFGRTINGVAGFFAAPWSGLSPYGGSNFADQAGMVNCVINSQIAANQQAANATWANGNIPPFQFNNSSSSVYFLRTFGPLFAPVLRPHFGNVHTVVAPYTRMPWVLPNVTLVYPNSEICIPPGTRRMCLQFGGGTTFYNGGTSYAAGYLYGTEQQMANGTPGRVQGTTDMNVMWRGTDGLQHRHPNDDLVSTGRGQISPTHDTEIYDVEKCFQAVAMNPVLGSGNIGQNVTTVTYVFSE